jgi:hypothetical protein
MARKRTNALSEHRVRFKSIYRAMKQALSCHGDALGGGILLDKWEQ